MNFNFNEIFDRMVSTVRSELASGGEEIMKYGQSIFENNKDRIESLSLMLSEGEITWDDFNLRMGDIETTIENQLLAEQVILKSTTQKAINSAIDILTSCLIKVTKLSN